MNGTLEESERHVLHLMEDSLVGICIIRQNLIAYQNSILKKLLGSLPESFENDFFDHLHPDDVEKCKDMYRQITSGRRRTAEADFRFYPPGVKGRKVTPCWVQCRISPMNHQGENAILLQMMDITRIKETEHLLTVKQKMSSLGHVAAGIAHEIRNPLTGINSYLYTLEDLCNSKIIEADQIETVKQIVSQLQIASDKIEAVVKRVLDFSKPNSPKMVLIDLNKCIEDTVSLSAATLRKDDIAIEKSLESDLPKCYGDVHLIEQVLLNLINNAAKAMEKNQTAKRIQIDSYGGDKRLFIQVSDSGPGIPKELTDKVFDPFFTTRNDGSGIGLSIAQRIVADHNGTIEILKSKWGGATLSVELPIEKRRHST
jgi:PAS domain S-box-containing protein